MKQYVPFDLDKVGKYADFVRASSGTLVNHFVGAGVSLYPSPSLPISSWLYYKVRLGQTDAGGILKILDKDSQRARFRCGHDITLSDDLTPRSEEETLYDGALDLIRTYWPEMALLIQRIDPRVSLPPPGETYESASNPLLFGQIYYNMKKATAIDWARILTHEIAHHYLFILTAEWEAKGIRFAWDDTVYSSIKDTQRPLIGLLHGGYAQACMLELASRIEADRAAVNQEVKDGVDWIFRRYGKGFLSDCTTLEGYHVIEAASELQTTFSRSRESTSAVLQ